MTKPRLLTDDEIAARLRDLDWALDEGAIVRNIELKDFAAAIAFVNRVADLAQSYDHHPDILVHGWNQVKLSLTNHAAGGLTAIDFDMATRFDALLRQPGRA